MTVTTWNTNAGDGLYETETNWTNGCPSGAGSGLGAFVTGAGVTNYPESAPAISIKSLDFSGYTGAFVSAGDHTTFTMTLAYSIGDGFGDFTLSAAMSGTEHLRAEFDGSGEPGNPVCHLTCAGHTLQAIYTATNNASDLTLTLMDDARCYFFQLRDGSSILALGAHTLYTLVSPDQGGYFEMIDGSRLTYSAGAKLVFNTTGTLPMEMNIDGILLAALPPIEIIGTGTMIQDTANPIRTQSLTISGGASIDGGTWNVVGAAVASGGGTISNTTFTGAGLVCTGCIDGGGNTNVTFVGSHSTSRRHLAGPILLRRPKRKQPEEIQPEPEPPSPEPPPQVDPEQHFAGLLQAMSDAFASAQAAQPPAKPPLPGIILAPMDALLRALESEVQ